MEYGSDHAAYYDRVFRSRGKSFEGEAQELTKIIRGRSPHAASLLDVACGTGAHLETFAKLFDHVEGVELSPDMREVAGRRLPGVPLHPGDMRDFDLGRGFDAVTCMGNAVGELGSFEELVTAIGRMAEHLEPGGVLVVEPWYFPENFLDGHVGGHTLVEDGLAISRMTHSRREGGKSRLEVRFRVADRDGFKDFAEVLYSSLFTQEQYLTAFGKAGCRAEFRPAFKLADGRPNSPGLFVGVRDGLR
ncbi:MAG: class I SAM-dependent methyltransferase [Nonomuraea sp.]|nr:class I SAM-dependent methyltransferase [Nonomuraea sp.]NUP63902.1 class I SAM-dependent methyltransferase [Nonomuraea sp.]NUP84040.1 class I SAM-dependent methyltransferase [Nonomuraea sp.]NUS02980.1 class I SAM-dependent methyltransferase [Nonomuraea sp.]NUT39167.1 class I SAM-dependent methyltransferase [Thermoactinospora sp.]